MTDIEARIEVLRLKDGDTLIVQFPRHLTKKQREHIRDHVTPLIPDGVKALVLDPDIVVTHVAAPEPHPVDSNGFDTWMRDRTEQAHRDHMWRTARLPACARSTYSPDEIAKFYGVSHGGID